jgi:signal peptidase I
LNDTIPQANEPAKVEADEPAASPAKKQQGKGSALWREIKGLLWVLLAVLAFHSLVAKPFYIPSESMMPGLLTGDRLVVSKYPYGWSWVSPSFHVLPPIHGRLFGRQPQRGDIVIVTPPGQRSDYIKRVIGLPGDTLRMVDGQLWINGRPVKRVAETPDTVPIDINSPCGSSTDSALYDFRVQGPDGKMYCRVPVFRETLPNGRTYETVELGRSPEDNFGPVTIPPDHLWLMGDNRDDSADSRIPEWQGGLGGPVPWENIGGRAEFITFSLNGSTQWWNPISWIEALRHGRAGRSLRNS